MTARGRSGRREAEGGDAGAYDVLRVYKDGRPVGVLRHDAANLIAFAYDSSVLDDPAAAVSVRLPVRAAPYPDHEAAPCFENLLAEGDVRRTLATASHRAPGDVVGLLGVFGGECAGALALWPEGSAPPAGPEYLPCSAADVMEAFDVANGLARIAALLRAGRLSMSGAQEKLVLYRRPATGRGADGASPQYLLPRGGSPSTVLVKRDRGQFPGLLHNELAAMSLMAAAGVPTAPHAPNALDPAVYETARFDRVLRADGGVTRLHAEDGCQITGKLSRQKYAQTGGPTYAQLVAALARYSAAPLEDGEILFRWAVANLALGNRDAHAKNVSVLYPEPGALRLAPAYDVVCTLAYPGLDTALPIRFGGQPTVAALTPRALGVAAREFKIAPARAAQLADTVCAAVLDALPRVLTDVARMAGPDPILATMDRTVRDEAAAVRRALLDA